MSRAMSRAERIEAALRAALAPEALAVIDESHRHAGHAGARPEGETHYRVEITAAAFAGQSRVARQRAVYDLLKEELATGLHALSVAAKAPGEG